MDKILFNNLSFSFGDQPLLKNISANFNIGKIHLLTGVSGSGKSTLLKLIAGLLPKYGGHITTGNINVTTTNQIGMLFQDPLMQFALDTPRHELEFILENCQVPTDQIPLRVSEALHFGQVDSLADRQITTLSGGQQQRVALSAVMAMHPQILLLDEPFANIDETNRQFILTRLLEINQQYRTTIIITDHDFHDYQKLNPIVWKLINGHLTTLSAEQEQELFRFNSPIKAKIPSSTAFPVIKFVDLSITRGTTKQLTSTTLSLIKNKVTLLTGPNGIGKSTLLKAIVKSIPYQGKITYNNVDIQKISPGKYYQHVGLVFQHTNDQFVNITVGEELALSLKNGQNPYFTKQHLQQALVRLDLNSREDQVVYSLSGGQKKKLQILLMLIMGQNVLLLDEPFAGLDNISLKNVLNLINVSRKNHPQTMLIVSHQLAGLADFIDYHLDMNHQQIKYLGGTS